MNQLAITSSLFFILSCYVGIRVFSYLPLKRKWIWLLFFAYLFFAENFLIHRIIYKAGYLDAMPDWASLTMSIGQAACIILALVSGTREILLTIWLTIGRPIFKPVLHDPTEARQKWLKFMHKLSIAMCIIAALVTAKGVYNAIQLPVIKEVEIYSEKLPIQLDNFRIVQISDQHITKGQDVSWIAEVVQTANSLKPDVIVMTGDMLDGKAMQMQKELAPLNELSAPYGVFVISGNHEYYLHYGSWYKYMTKVSKHSLLINSGKIIKINGATLGIAGMPDELGQRNWQGPNINRTYSTIKNADYKILLWHRPKHADQAAEKGFDLQLSGHTHGGQFFPGNLLAAIPNKYAYGLYDVNGMPLYVNPGSMLWGRVPLRLVVQSEITLIILKRKE